MMKKSQRVRARENAAVSEPDTTLVPTADRGEELPPARVEELGRRSAMVVVSNAAIAIEGIRVATQVRLKHLGKRGATCAYTEQIFARAQEFERWADQQLAELVTNHPAANWLKRVKGIGGESIGKVLGHIEAFGRFYPVGDPKIPSFVHREPTMVPVPVEGKKDQFVETAMIWVDGIERLQTPSKLRKYAGLLPGMKRKGGKKSPFNTELRTMLWRVGSQFLKAQGKYAGFYDDYKARKVGQLVASGVHILPTPKARFCPECQIEVVLKTARLCPNCGGELTTKTEPEGVLWKGHVHMRCMRRMIQLFSDHLWVVWREALGLPIRTPYPIEYLGHSQVITPWDMVDR